MIGYVMIVATLIGCAVSPSYSVFLACRFLAGVAAGSYLCYYVLMTEVLGQDYRSLPATLACVVFGIGFSILAGIAYLVPNWRVFTLLGAATAVCSAPLFR